MHLRSSETEITVKGNFNSESKFILLPSNQEVSLLSQTGRGYFVMGLIGVGQEPTNHALKDIAKVAQVFEKWNRPIVLLFEDEASAKKSESLSSLACQRTSFSVLTRMALVARKW